MGLSPFRRRDVLGAMETVIHATQADVLCLQEDMSKDDVSETQMSIRCREIWGQSVFGKTVVHPRGAQGNSILSRFAIINSESRALPSFGDQHRNFLRATIDCGGRLPVVVICLHLGLNEKHRLQQIKAVARYIESNIDQNQPVVLAGDFNDWRERLSTATLLPGFREAVCETSNRRFRTFPAWLPTFRLDRILLKNCSLNAARVMTDSGRLGRSDHLPVIADISIP